MEQGAGARPGQKGLRSATPLDWEAWAALDAQIRAGWLQGRTEAMEAQIRQDPQGNLLFLPRPYITPGGSPTAPAAAESDVFREMYNWDTYFINRGLLAHDLTEPVRDHILNYLFMIDRFGYMPNGNRTPLSTRSQIPVFPDSIWRYFQATGDRELLAAAYPRLRREFFEYWLSPPHQTAIGLSTNIDPADPLLPPELSAEAEALDWTPIYGGDIRRCVPLITNCALVSYAATVADMAQALGDAPGAEAMRKEAGSRARRIRDLQWDGARGLFCEYDAVAGQKLPYVSDGAFWPLWAGVATAEQAAESVRSLQVLRAPWGITATDRAYPDPHRPGLLAEGALQWMYPAGWPPSQWIACEGLDRYGHHAEAEQVAASFLHLVLSVHKRTGRLWEKYNVVDAGLELPNARYGVMPMQGWTAACVAVLGRRLLASPAAGQAPH